MTTDAYRTASYWNRRLMTSFNLRGVGRACFDERYNRWLYRAKRRCLESIFRRERLSSSFVLDVGCGTGFFVDWFLRRGAKVEGLDIARVSVDRLEPRFPAARFTRRDIGATRFEPLGTFHIVNAWDVLYHIVDDDAFERALTNIAGCCDEGTRLVLTDRLGAAVDERMADHVKFRSLATYDAILERLGFESVRTIPLYRHLNRWRPEWDAWNNRSAPVLFALDRLARRLPADNLSVGVWRRAIPKVASADPDDMWLLAS